MSHDDDEQINAIVKGMDELLEETTVKIALDITANLQETTPVDTGWARANWVPSLGDPFAGTAGTREDAENGQIDTGAQTSGIAEVAGFKLVQKSVWISNNVPYITRLNEGWSKQAPAGFIQDAIEKAVKLDINI